MAGSAEPRPRGCQVHEGDAAVDRLADMGLRVEHLSAAFRRGHDRQAQCQPVHPRTYRGQVMWAETVAQLRTTLLELGQGWDMGRAQNYETVFHPGRNVAIAVVGGDVNTGVRGFHPPKAARRRGPITRARVERNRWGQLTLDGAERAEHGQRDDERCYTWLLLLRAYEEVMYSELSLPVSIGADLKIGRWEERILLPRSPLSGAAVTPIDPDEDDQPHTVHVERR